MAWWMLAAQVGAELFKGAAKDKAADKAKRARRRLNKAQEAAARVKNMRARRRQLAEARMAQAAAIAGGVARGATGSVATGQQGAVQASLGTTLSDSFSAEEQAKRLRELQGLAGKETARIDSAGQGLDLVPSALNLGNSLYERFGASTPGQDKLDATQATLKTMEE